MKPLPIQPELLDKYLNGVCTTEEKRMVEDWYFELDKNANDASNLVPSFNKAALFERIQAEIEQLHPFDHRPERLPLIKKYSRLITGVAAMLILIAGISFFMTRPSFGIHDRIVSKAEHFEIQNKTEVVVQKTLPDGSIVWLKPGATLIYERHDEKSKREVAFAGEAFFEVAKDPLHPFIITAAEMKIRVVGTSFNVIALPNSRTFKVTVVTGKVQVTADNKKGQRKTILLLPKQQASFNLGSHTLVQTEINSVQLKKQLWKPFSLSFSDATMETVSEELEKAFQIKIHFSNPAIANCHLKVDFNNQQLNEVLTLLEKLLDVECEMVDEGTLRIVGEGCEKND
jgi:ferric-dicitrate binding protein FerR (iron transport regulator)